MKSIKKFIGTDVNLEISLFEYGVICKPYKKDGRKDEYFCLYNQNGLFGSGYITEEFLDNLINGKEWMDNKDVESFLGFTGFDQSFWLNSLPFITKLTDLLNYYGSENIFGTDYNPWTEDQIRELYEF